MKDSIHFFEDLMLLKKSNLMIILKNHKKSKTYLSKIKTNWSFLLKWENVIHRFLSGFVNLYYF